MNNITKFYVGVDVSKDKLDIHIHPSGKTLSVPNTGTGMTKLIKVLSAYMIEQIVCEATGGYEDLMVNKLRAADYKVWRVEPNRIKSFIRFQGKKVKTDWTDAQMIALFSSQCTQEHEYIDYGTEQGIVHDLVKRRTDVVGMIKAEKQRLKHPSLTTSKPRIEKHIKYMEKELKGLNAEIQKLIVEDAGMRNKAKIIESVPGIGATTAAMLLAELPELGSVEKKKIAALIGVAPYTKQSGQYKGKATISGGRIPVRSALFMVALVASRHNKTIKEFYDRLRNVHKKPAKVALTAVMRKLAEILNAMVRNQTVWRYIE